MEELAGDDAVYVDPTDVESIRDGIARAFSAAPRARRRRGPTSSRRTRAVYEAVA